MSNKRGRRNGKWHKEKSNRRLQTKRDELGSQSNKVEYVPLEKPVFAGWDIKIGLTESGTRRKDSESIQKVLHILNLSREMFTRDIKFVKHIRVKDHHIDSIKSFYQYRGYYIDNFSIRHITYNEYHNLSEDLKKYFYPDKHYKYSRYDKPYYEVDSPFPWYECKVVITKSYYNYRRVYDTVAQSEYYKLDGDLYIVDRKSWGRGYHRDDFNKPNKASYNKSLRRIITNQYSSEEIDDNYSEIFRGTNNKRNYGWS